MRRIISIVLVVALVLVSAIPAMAQSRSSRSRTDSRTSSPTPSFRGGQQPAQRGMMPMQGGPGMQQGGVGMPQDGSVQPGIPQMGFGYQVHVLGEVMLPGTYRIPPSGRLADAILMAGGLAETGSERRIELKRKGRKDQIVDLQKFMLFGSLANNPYLLDNDVVFVPLRKDVIQVVGAVKRPRVYELRGENNLFQVMCLAGGFNAATAMDEPIRVVRFKDGEKRVEEVANNAEAFKRFKIRSGDVVVVPNVVTKGTEFDYNIEAIPGDQVFYPSFEDRVFVLGGVRQPGAYPFSPYYTVNQYISLAGGVTQRGKDKYTIIAPSGKSRIAHETDRVNPGETIKIKERWMTPAGWLGFGLGMASFGLSASATILAITR